LYAYVHKEVPSAAARLDQFLSRNGVATDERVTVISDDAGEFEKAVQGSSKAVERIKALDARLLTREGYEFSTLWWNLNTVCGYLRNNANRWSTTALGIARTCRSAAASPSPR
jgi:hypothetical protein